MAVRAGPGFAWEQITMTRDDIERITRQAGGFDATPEFLARFAALVAAPLQERIQLLYEQLGEAEKQLDAQYKLGMEAEREACAYVAEQSFNRALDGYEIADAILARGNA